MAVTSIAYTRPFTSTSHAYTTQVKLSENNTFIIRKSCPQIIKSDLNNVKKPPSHTPAEKWGEGGF